MDHPDGVAAMSWVDLISRLEAAHEGDRGLDMQIAFAVQWRPDGAHGVSFREHEAKHDYHTAWIAHVPWHSEWKVPAFTTSVDAALTLLSPEDFWQIGHDGDGPNPGDFKAMVQPGCEARWHRRAAKSLHATPALALCIAALKAREAAQ